MRFEEVLPHVRAGKSAYRSNWNGVRLGKTMYVTMPSIRLSNELPYLQLITRKDNSSTEIWTGWIPSVADLFAEDWEIFEPDPVTEGVMADSVLLREE